MVPAHSQKGNPLAIGRDSKDEVVRRGPNPPVPRAPRAAPKAQSAGALARDLWSRRPSSGNLSNVSRTSEQRRPREESPFSQISAQQQHRRVACLSREKEMAENQAFEMGPRKRPSSRTDYSRGHILGKEIEANNGIPFGPEKSQDDGQAPRPAARRHTLRHEQQAAEQALEWVPERHPGGQRTDHARVSTLKREEGEPYDFLPGASRRAASAAVANAEGNHARRNMLQRELTSIQSIDMPQTSGNSVDGAVPHYGRVGSLVKENPAGFHRMPAAVCVG